MAKHMLIDATHPEETRVVVVDGKRLEEFDVELASKKQLKGNIYLAKVTRVEPSLQAAFVEYGGNRHGFLAFSEIHPDYYRIPVADREALLAEEAREARGGTPARKRATPRPRRARSRRRGGGRQRHRSRVAVTPRRGRTSGTPKSGDARRPRDETVATPVITATRVAATAITATTQASSDEPASSGNRVPQELWPAQALDYRGRSTVVGRA